ncbi:restriction endonuclease subunit S [Pseudonocardia bannensis]|uniref:Type I restriction modification DNA specificity domain-containing protein n=1 Tax=Pseudonocardia bannensis TaxID=630973 RepID=A0A848DFT4_9PSEU|nr:restriction endonuclease subunit S [Pseudonocardia bannensis]NMH91436.1 hypothetical protein [Pseudonocardia bannensis]
MKWPVVKLGDVAETALGRMLDRGRSNGYPEVPYLRNINVQWGRIDTADLLTMELPDELRDRFEVRTGDLLVCEGGEIGRAAVWSGSGTYVAYQKALHRVRPSADLDNRYLRYLLEHHANNGVLTRLATGSTIAHLPQQKLREVPVPLAPIDRQRHIVDTLESHLSHLDSATATLSRAKSATRAMMRSILQVGLRGELVDDDLSEGTGADLVGDRTNFTPSGDDRVWPVPETWRWARLGDLFEVSVGATPSRSVPELWAGDLPWVSSGEVSFGRISSTREHITRSAAGNPRTRIHPPGTVMLAMIGEGKTRGQAAILDVEAAHNQNCASIRVSGTKILPEYVYAYLEERYFETRRGGSGGQQLALNKATIKRFAMPIAPLATQRRMIQVWNSVRDKANRLTNELDLAQARSDGLRKALLAAAFSGNLTGDNAQDREVAATS